MPKPPKYWFAQPQVGDEQSAEASVADAKFVIQEVGNWIKNADAKSTVAAAATGVVATATASKADVIRAAMANAEFHCKWALLLLLFVALVSLIVSGYYQFRTLSPRTSRSGTSREGQTNRFAWPNLKDNGPPETYRWLSVKEEAWEQASALAHIADRKFASFKLALAWFAVGFIATVATIGLATWQSSPPIP